MRRLQQALAVAFCVAGVACGGSKVTGPSESGSPGNQDPSNTILSGTERLSWNQRVDSAAVLAGLSFVAYVDESRATLPRATCSAPDGNRVASCSSGLPAMASGPHVLSVVAVDAAGHESPRSTPLSIQLTRSTLAVPTEAGPAIE